MDFSSLINGVQAAVNGGATAGFVITLVGAVVAIAGAVLLYVMVFGPKSKDPNSGKLVKAANGQHFLPASVIKIAYYTGAIFLLFKGIAAFPLEGGHGVNTFISQAIFGNVVLRIGFELVMAARKSVGIDTDNNTAEEPKTEQFIKTGIPQLPPQHPYQAPQYQPQAQQQYQQPEPVPQQYQQPMPVPQPFQQPVPQQESIPQPIPQPVPQPENIPQPEPVPQYSTCPNCGKQLKAGAKFCPFCGKPTV